MKLSYQQISRKDPARLIYPHGDFVAKSADKENLTPDIIVNVIDTTSRATDYNGLK